MKIAKLEVQQDIVCRFAPEGRDVYSLGSPFLYSEAPWERNRFWRPGEGSASRVSLLAKRDLWACALAINISLLWSENEFNCCLCKLNSPNAN